MADEEHVALLKQGVEVWNTWREQHPDIRPDLSQADLRRVDLAVDLTATLGNATLSLADLSLADLGGADLRRADLGGADLRRADLGNANLGHANLGHANLSGAILSGAILDHANLDGAYLSGANLSAANLVDADLTGALLAGANLSGANLSKAQFFTTVFGATNLTRAKGLETCQHWGRSIIDHGSLQRSGPLPQAFLRGVGLPDNLIDYLPSLLNQPIQFFSCFISYSSKDQEFADRLHADLQNKGVRCWFAPHDMPIGAKIIDAIDEAIRLRDKVLLVLSEHSVASRWVEGEVTRSLDEEDVRNQVVLFPVRIDDTVMETTKPWARLLRGQRSIGNFTCWKDHDAYQKVLEKLLRDLKVTQAEP